jgi:hypothetical protein
MRLLRNFNAIILLLSFVALPLGALPLTDDQIFAREDGINARGITTTSEALQERGLFSIFAKIPQLISKIKK